KTDGQLHLDLPFADERIDHLSRMRSVAQPGDFAKEMLAIRSDQEDLLWRCFTESGPQPYAENHHQGVRLKLFASGCMIIEFKGRSMVIDPVIGSAGERGAAGLTYADLPEQIDCL